MTQTLSKPAKAARTIVSSRLTSEGMKTTLAVSAAGQLERARDLCKALRDVHELKEEAGTAFDGLEALLTKAAK